MATKVFSREYWLLWKTINRPRAGHENERKGVYFVRKQYSFAVLFSCLAFRRPLCAKASITLFSPANHGDIYVLNNQGHKTQQTKTVSVIPSFLASTPVISHLQESSCAAGVRFLIKRPRSLISGYYWMHATYLLSGCHMLEDMLGIPCNRGCPEPDIKTGRPMADQFLSRTYTMAWEGPVLFSGVLLYLSPFFKYQDSTWLCEISATIYHLLTFKLVGSHNPRHHFTDFFSFFFQGTEEKAKIQFVEAKVYGQSSHRRIGNGRGKQKRKPSDKSASLTTSASEAVAPLYEIVTLNRKVSFRNGQAGIESFTRVSFCHLKRQAAIISLPFVGCCDKYFPFFCKIP